jgi:RNA polymerase sigma-70 factor (ECF subfamily)
MTDDPSTGEGPSLTPEIRDAQRGDDEAFRRLYRALQPILLRYLQTLVGADAEDVAAEAWLQISRDIRTFRGDWDQFRGWTVTIARHRAMDHLRSQRRRPAVSMPVHHLLDLPADHDTAARAEESVATDEALAMIAALPRDQAEAVYLRVLVGLDAQTCGKILGKRAGAVRTAAYRGLRQLAEQLSLSGVTSPRRPALKE